MTRHANSTSFIPGYQRSQESIEKQRATLKARGQPSHLKGAATTPEAIAKRSATRRKNAIGNRRKSGHGYWLVMTEDGYRYEHRIVMEQIIGRSLKPNEVVHHVNHDGLDNRPENLQLLTPSDHNTAHGRTINPQAARLAPGTWSRKHERCVVCGTTDRKHLARGMCSTCYRNQYGRYPR